MNLLLITAISISIGAGVLLLLSRDIFRIAIGLTVFGSAVNLVVFLGGRPGTLVPAVIEAGKTLLPQDAASPLPQALVLTAIVIAFALLCLGLVIGARVSRAHDEADLAELRASEPPHATGPDDDRKPPVMDEER